MRKSVILPVLMAGATIFQGFAADETKNNRMIVNLPSGEQVVYATKAINNITFEQLDEVKAPFTVDAASANSLTVTVNKSIDCATFYLAAIPADNISESTDMAALIKEEAKTTLGDETIGQQITIHGLKENTDYVVATLALDKFGIEEEIIKAQAHTAEVPVTNFKLVFESAYEGDKYEKNSGYFTLSLMTVYDATNANFEALNIEGFLPLEAGANLVEGTYTLEDNEEFTGTPLTFLTHHNISGQSFGTYYTAVANGQQTYYIPAQGSTLKVEKVAEGFKITADCIDANGEKHIFTYTGAVEFPGDAALKFEGELQQAEAQYAGKYVGQETDQIVVTFSGMTMGADGDMNVAQMVLMFYTDSATELPQGKYTLAGDAQKAPFTIQRGFFLGYGPNPSYFYNQSSYHGENMVLLDGEGEVTVTKNGDIYTFDIKLAGTDLVSGESAKLSYTYTGALVIK